ncbi:L-fucose-proton symporter [Trichophyton mentagrophytes]|nr:L-fucose-proton symporter [Trichophyton mentagrophytes]
MALELDHESNHGHGVAMFTVTLVVVVLSACSVTLRLASRLYLRQAVKIRDYLIVLAWITAFGLSFSILYGAYKGFGIKMEFIPPELRSLLKKGLYAFSVLYSPTLMLTKTSVLLYYVESIPKTRAFRVATYATLFVVNAAGLALLLLNVFRCRPIRSAYIYPAANESVCTNFVDLNLASVPLNVVTDFAILVLPLPVLSQMTVPFSHRTAVALMFTAGAMFTTITLIRTAMLQHAHIAQVQAKEAVDWDGVDENEFPWHASESFMWSAVEVNAGIICTCVPMMKQLASRLFVKFSGKSHRSASRRDIKEKAPMRRPFNRRDSVTSPSLVFDENRRSCSPDSGYSDVDVQASYRESRSKRCHSHHLSQDSFHDRGAVKPKRTKSMLELTNKEALPFLTAIIFLLFLWGFGYGLLNTVNFRFLIEAKATYAKAIGLHAAYFAGYLIGPAAAGYLLKKTTFKLTFIVGLCLYACGILISWTSAVLTSFETYVFSNVVTGAGMAIVQTTSHPFLALCGPQEYAEMRLNIALGFQSIGSVISSILAKKAFSLREIDAHDLVQMKWAYFAMALLHIILAIAMHYLSLPEANDNQLADLARQRQMANSAKIYDIRVVWVTLGLAVFAQFLFVGGSEGINVHFRKLARRTRIKNVTPFESQALGFALFAVGRFATVALQLVAKPRVILSILYLGLIGCAIAAVTIHGRLAMIGALGTYFFGSGIYGLTFAIALRGMGHHTKTASAFLTAAVSGGAVFTCVQRAVANSRGVQFSFLVPTILFAVCLIFPIYLNSFAPAKRHTDPTLKNHRARGTSVAFHPTQDDRGEGFAVPESIFPSQETIARVVQKSQDRSSAYIPTSPTQAPKRAKGHYRGGGLMHSLSSWHTSLRSPTSDRASCEPSRSSGRWDRNSRSERKWPPGPSSPSLEMDKVNARQSSDYYYYRSGEVYKDIR